MICPKIAIILMSVSWWSVLTVSNYYMFIPSQRTLMNLSFIFKTNFRQISDVVKEFYGFEVYVSKILYDAPLCDLSGGC